MSRNLIVQGDLRKRNDFCVRYWVCVIIYAKEKSAHKDPQRNAPRNVYFGGLVDVGQQFAITR